VHYSVSPCKLKLNAHYSVSPCKLRQNAYKTLALLHFLLLHSEFAFPLFMLVHRIESLLMPTSISTIYKKQSKQELFGEASPCKTLLKKNSAYGGQTAPATLCLRKKTFSRRPRKPPNTVSRPYTGARYPVSGPVRCLCFGKLETGEGIFLTPDRRTSAPVGARTLPARVPAGRPDHPV